MKLNRKWLLVVALVLSMTMAISGTLAYLTDRDSEVNTFTMGDVSIDLKEDFVQDSELLPGNKVPKETFITNTGDSDAYVWMTMAVPAALDDENADLGTGSQALHWNVPGVVWKGYGDTSWATEAKVQTAKDNGWVTDVHIGDNGLVKADCLWTICQDETDPVAIKTETIDDVEYNVYTFLYNGVLEKDATTPVALHQVYLDTKIDVDTDGKWYLVNNGKVTDLGWTNNDQIKVIVSAYAIQAEGLKDMDNDTDVDVVDAYKLYTQQWGDNGTEYDGGEEEESTPPTTSWDDNADTAWYEADTSATTYEIDTAAELAGLSNLVAGGVNFSGKTINLTADVDLGDHQWTPIGQTGGFYADAYFQGTFDGQNHTISNLYITETNEGANYAVGLFGFVDAASATIQNVKIDGAVVNGHHWTAVLVGYMTGDVTNCHVTNSTVTCTHANDDACGDKAATLIGYLNDNGNVVTNNSATNCVVKAGRDAGAIIGAAYTATNTISDNVITNVTVEATGDCTGANISNNVIGREL